jgi:hypothetical protein
MNTFLAVFVVTLALLLPFSSAAQNQHSDDDRRVDQSYGDHDRWQSRLSPEDQSRFDSYYSRWLTARQSGDRSEIASTEKRMRDVMGHYSIPPNVQFSEIASDSVARYHGPQIPRFSGNDANDFRSYYSRWQNYKRSNNRQQAASMEERMRKIMSAHNIPDNASYADVMDMLTDRDR